MKKPSKSPAKAQTKEGYLGQFRTLSEILQYLTAQGRQITISSLKKHSMSRRLPRQADGTWTLRDVDTYGCTLPTVPSDAAPVADRKAEPVGTGSTPAADHKAEPKPAGSTPAASAAADRSAPEPDPLSDEDMDALDASDLARLKLQKEIGRLAAQTRGMNFDNDVKAGKFFRKSEVLLEFATRTAVLYQCLRQDLLAAVPDVIRAGAGGETAMRTAVEQALDAAINQFSRPLSATLDLSQVRATPEDVDDAV